MSTGPGQEPPNERSLSFPKRLERSVASPPPSAGAISYRRPDTDAHPVADDPPTSGSLTTGQHLRRSLRPDRLRFHPGAALGGFQHQCDFSRDREQDHLLPADTPSASM